MITRGVIGTLRACDDHTYPATVKSYAAYRRRWVPEVPRKMHAPCVTATPGGQVLILINILDTFFIDIDLVLFYWFFQYELKNYIFTKNIEFFYWFQYWF